MYPCQRPSALYIGEMGKSLHKRISGHICGIRNGKTQKRVSDHFNLDLKVTILRWGHYKMRLERESRYIQMLQTCLKGLSNQRFLSHYQI